MGTLVDELKKAGLVSAKEIEAIGEASEKNPPRPKTTPKGPTEQAGRKSSRPRGLLKIFACTLCGEPYEDFESDEHYKRKRTCGNCKKKGKPSIPSGVGNSHHRPKGHKTRQQHKKVFPRRS